MHKFLLFKKQTSLLSIGINFLSMILMFPSHSAADIYRFVTVDGIESFTDAPLHKEAKIVIKDSNKAPSKNKKMVNQQKKHDISLNEVIEKTIAASQTPVDHSFPSSFDIKLPPVGGVITSGVGMRIDPIDGKYRHHNGIDIAIAEGTPITPVASGIVVYSGLRPGYGYTVLIEHNNGMISLYGHNSRLEAVQGQAVDQNTVIALSGNTGRSTGPHLHFEAWMAGTNVTPAFMPGSTMQLPRNQLASNKPKVTFRKEVLADGSVLFTNLPSSTH